MNTFDQVKLALGGKPNARGWYDAQCPACGKAPQHGQTHFGYRETGGHCFVCGWSGSLRELAELLRISGDEYIAPARQPQPPKPIARWRLNSAKLLAQYHDNPNRLERWRRYKPVTDETIERFDFGLGRLPFQNEQNEWYMSRAEWLIVPVRTDNELVALRGRNLTNHGAKWICATGSEMALWNVEQVRLGATVWLCENYVDAALLMQKYPQWDAVSIGGATTWNRRFAHQLVARRPARVIVALDNDLPGNGGGKRREQWLAEWTAQHPFAVPPAANGPKIVDELQLAGVSALLFDWPEDAPHKAGLDWAIL